MLGAVAATRMWVQPLLSLPTLWWDHQPIPMLSTVPPWCAEVHSPRRRHIRPGATCSPPATVPTQSLRGNFTDTSGMSLGLFRTKPSFFNFSLFFNCCSNTVVSIFLPRPPPPPQPSPPPTFDPNPLWLCPCVLYRCFLITLPPFPPVIPFHLPSGYCQFAESSLLKNRLKTVELSNLTVEGKIHLFPPLHSRFSYFSKIDPSQLNQFSESWLKKMPLPNNPNSAFSFHRLLHFSRIP